MGDANCVYAVARGKRAEGTEHARFCALYGLAGQIDYHEYVLLTLCESAALSALARSFVIALDVHAGRLGPEEYYGSRDEYLKALLRSRIPRR